MQIELQNQNTFARKDLVFKNDLVLGAPSFLLQLRYEGRKVLNLSH